MIDAKWDLEKILSICDDNSCDVSIEDERSKFSGTEYNQKVIEYVTGGIPVIMWDYIRSSLGDSVQKKNVGAQKKLDISSKCSNSLKYVIKSADQGMKWAFQSKF